MLSDERIAEIKARLAATTPGAWLDDFYHDRPRHWHIIWIDAAVIAETGRHQRNDVRHHPDARNAENAAFICAAHNMDIPDLLREVEELRAWKAAREAAS